MEVFKTVQVKSKDKLKEKIADKHYKLRQNDNDTFRCLFESIVLPTLDPNNKQTLLNLVQNRFHNLQSITLNTILQHYTQISINKIVKMLNMS